MSKTVVLNVCILNTKIAHMSKTDTLHIFPRLHLSNNPKYATDYIAYYVLGLLIRTFSKNNTTKCILVGFKIIKT